MATNIKISELNGFPFPEPLAANDFFPLVNSSSMTTYRLGLAELATIFTGSGYALGANFASGALFASRSISASHALISDNVSTSGVFRSIPFWKTPSTPSTNGALNTSSPLYISYSNLAWEGILLIDSGSSTYAGTAPGVLNPNRPNYGTFGYWNHKQNTFTGWPIYGASGIFTPWPIVSAGFIGTDQRSWGYSTSSLAPTVQGNFWSGSSENGFWADITQSSGPTSLGLGAISESFNGKWVRLACSSIFGGSAPDTSIATGSAYGENPNPSGGFFGRVRIVASTAIEGTNVNQVVDMDIHDAIWGGGITAHVIHSSLYGPNIIEKLRLTTWSARSSVNLEKIWNDPMMALDVFIDNLVGADYRLNITCQSWGGVRFLTEPNVGPPCLFDTGSSQYPPYNTTGFFDPKRSSYLEFPAAPGYYSTVGDSQYGGLGSGWQAYHFQGKRIQINPNRNETTESSPSTAKSQTLWVSGSISTQKYYCEDLPGQGGTFKAYTTSNGWLEYTHAGGILVASASTTSPISSGGTPDSALSASWASRSLQADTASYVTPSLNPGIPRAWAMCVCTASTTLPVAPNNYHVPGIDWHWLHIQSGYNVRAVTKDTNGTLGPHPVDFPLAPNDTSGPVSQTTLANPYQGAGANRHWMVTLNTTMSSTNYMVMGGGGGEQQSEYIHMTMFPQSKRTNTQFTLSMCDGNADFGSPPEIAWFTFAVYENPLNIGLSYPGWPIVTV